MEHFGGPETDLLGSMNPKRCLVGVVDNAEEVEAAREALTAAGFDDAHIATYTGEELLSNHRREAENKGLGAKIAGLFPSQEDDLKKSYLSEAEAGASFLLVRADNDEERDRAAEALRSVQARHLRYYGDLMIHDLSKERDHPAKQVTG